MNREFSKIICPLNHEIHLYLKENFSMTVFFNNITAHSLDRAKERLHKNRKEAYSYINKALTRGRSAEEFTSLERTYLENVQNRYRGRKTIVYDRNCFILTADAQICLTVFPLPLWFGRKKQFEGKTRIRNPKRYYNRYCQCS